MYKVGAFHERKLLDKFRKEGFEGVRAAGSSCPDLIVAKENRLIALECKYTSSEQIFLKRDNIARLSQFSKASGSPAFAALKFGRTEWLFLPSAKLAAQAEGTGHTIRKAWAEANGLTFFTLLSDWTLV